MSKNPILYYQPECPHCHQVVIYVEDHDIEIDFRNVDEAEFADELVKVTGQDAVPALVVDDEIILGDEPIIQYLAATYDDSPVAPIPEDPVLE